MIHIFDLLSSSTSQLGLHEWFISRALLKSKSPSKRYLFTLDKKYLLDGDFEFNKARLINHSCNPNCEVLDESKSKIWITAIRNIKKNEELSYDYGFSFDCNYKDHICKCGSKNCVGFIVREGSRWRLKKQTNI